MAKHVEHPTAEASITPRARRAPGRREGPGATSKPVKARTATHGGQRVLELTAEYLGTQAKQFHDAGSPVSRSGLHAYLVAGMPYRSLIHLTEFVLPEDDVASVVGLSTRTLRRQKDTPGKFMPPDLASRTWLLAETLAKATDVFGSKEDAVRWMSQDATGLDGARPLDLLRTLQGAELVTDFLGRMQHGVYN